MGVDRRTPGYIKEKLQREKLRERAGIRALKCEERLKEKKQNSTKARERNKKQTRKRGNRGEIEGRQKEISQG